MHRSPSRKIWRKILWGLLFTVLFMLSVVLGTTVLILSRFSGTAQLPSECGVVFGAAVYGSRPSMAVMRRVDRAADLYRQKMLSKIFVTGGKGNGARLSEAAVMKARLLSENVSPADIFMEDKARSTWENLLFTRPLTAGCTSVTGISDAFHLARIELLARRQGWKTIQTYPAPRPLSFRLEMQGLEREVAAYLYYALRLDRIWNIAPTAIYIEQGNRIDTPSVLVN
ncbi:YdcF family protein [Candidatus Peregrinibacteria bacterium]|nr:YdcF family protein [Candidatus Peregrinibacteria bacterium]